MEAGHEVVLHPDEPDAVVRPAIEAHVAGCPRCEAFIASYREADRRAPPMERGAIANRIAWLLKETGHDFAARRQFNRARGAYASHTAYVTYLIIAICAALDERLNSRRY